MRPLRMFAVSLVFVFGLLTVSAAQQTSSSASTEGIDYPQGEAYCHNASGLVDGPTKEICSGSYQDPEGLFSISGASGAVANYSGLGIGGNATVVIEKVTNESYIAGMSVNSSASISDYLYPQGDFTGTSFLFLAWGVIGNPSGNGTVTVELSVNLTNTTRNQGTDCDVQAFASTCSTQVVAYSGDTIELDANFSGEAYTTCEPKFCGEISVGFSSGYKSPGGGRPLIATVVDGNGKPVKGATVSSASGHKYPSKFASTTTLISNPNPSTEGQEVTFTATVASFGRTTSPTGKVTFTDTTTGTVLGKVTLKGGVATFETSELAVDTHAITATYPGDDWSDKSVSSAVDQIVN